MRILSELRDALLDTLFPPRCPLCRAYTERRGDWCACCRQRALFERRLGLDARQLRYLDAAYAVCRYRGIMQSLIRALKYQRSFTVLPYIQTLLAEAALPDPLLADCAVPVPLHRAKYRERGFNQTEKIFAPWIARQDMIWLDALERTRATAAQYGLQPLQRRQNLRGAFRVTAADAICGRRVLLLDDIFTTGATMQACAEALKTAGAAAVVGLALTSDA